MAEKDVPWWQMPAAKVPPAETLDWVAKAVGPGTRVVGARRLTGGIISSVHRLRVENRQGQRHSVVLRRYLVRPERHSDWIRREARMLELLAKTDLPVPRLLASDPDGGASGGFPALLMTQVPGQVYLAPRDGES